MGLRCFHVDKHKLPTNYILVAYWNLEGTWQGPHAPTNDLQVPITKGLKEGLEGGPKFEKMRVARWDIRTLPHQIPSTFERVNPYSQLEFDGQAA